MQKSDALSLRLGILLALFGILSITFQVISFSYPDLVAFRALAAVFQVLFVCSLLALVVWRLRAGVPTQRWGSKAYWSGTISLPNDRCAECGYDLTGNTSGTCPECGSPVTNGGSKPIDWANRVDPRPSMIAFVGFSAVCCAGVLLAILFANQLRSLGIVLAIMCGCGALGCLLDRMNDRNHRRRR